MSDALKYLMQIRPNEMENYFSFLKNSGRHLDDKTKAIISVITKVDKQTAAGFKQYLKRALALGVTGNEIIDALFTAFPTLGLSKIIWATDILLEMNFDEFKPENMQATPVWHQVLPEKELTGGASTLNCDGKDLIVYKDDDGVRVYDCHCPHQSTKISILNLEGLELTCPQHKWKFDIRNGECTEPGDSSLNSYECKIENGFLMVQFVK
jgi:nitrite reductase/ring-hydroxylating ferredoxin subunit/alkylhydroperoxidase/carboxymuconolactone decarboxylase family protein YurZ